MIRNLDCLHQNLYAKQFNNNQLNNANFNDFHFYNLSLLMQLKNIILQHISRNCWAITVPTPPPPKKNEIILSNPK